MFVNADFGYQPAGDHRLHRRPVWFDADGGGDCRTPADYGIPGVTVALIKDTTATAFGTRVEPIIATDTTDANGDYSFTGLPTAGDRVTTWSGSTTPTTCWAARMRHYDATGAADGLSCGAEPDQAAVTDQDFGYTADGCKTSKGMIGDTIWLNYDGDAVQDAGEPGIEGVVVELYDSTGTTLLATHRLPTRTATTTSLTCNNATYVGQGGEHGNFLTGGALHGMTNTYDPDGTDRSTSRRVTISGGNTDLLQDFGYTRGGTRAASAARCGTTSTPTALLDEISAERYDQGVTVDLYRDLNGNGRWTRASRRSARRPPTPTATYSLHRPAAHGMPTWWT